MFGIFKELKTFIKLDEVWIDNTVFRLHYKVTVIIFLTASLLVTSRQYIGDPIDCIVDGVPPKIMDTYCWIHSTFSIPSRWNGKIGLDIPHPGISPKAKIEEGTDVKYHKYYQWVCFVLFLQAGGFYLPRYVWKIAEGGKIRMLIQDLQEPILTPDSKDLMIENLVRYWYLYRGKHLSYALSFWFCELLNLANVFFQIFFTDFFLDGEFFSYGFDVLTYSEMEPEDRPDPMAKVFPKVTKCTFFKYGPSGTVETKDGLCVLPVNIINEKIYIFIWFWLLFLAAVTSIFLIGRIILTLGNSGRVGFISSKGGHSIDRRDIEEILNPDGLSYMQKVSDWLLLNFIVKNLDVLTVNQIIKKLAEDQRERKKEKMAFERSAFVQPLIGKQETSTV